MTYRYCGRDVTSDELALIRRLIVQDPSRTRAERSRLTCQALDWRKADGGLKAMSARVAMLRMHEDGLIELPPPRCQQPSSKVRITTRSDPRPKLHKPAAALKPLRLHRVQDNSHSQLYNEYIERYHYLGYTPLPGAQLRDIVHWHEEPLALLGFGASAWTCAPRDDHIGWTHEQRRRNLHLIVNNARFLILPWIESPTLASMILAMAAKMLPDHWHAVYGYRPVLLETFVETARFKGPCYQAANWVYLGQTKGRGKLGPAGTLSVPIKGLWVYPLNRRFRETLTG